MRRRGSISMSWRVRVSSRMQGMMRWWWKVRSHHYTWSHPAGLLSHTDVPALLMYLEVKRLKRLKILNKNYTNNLSALRVGFDR